MSDPARDSIVYIVDDDEAVCDSLGLLLKTVDIPSRAFHSAADFLAAYDPDQPGCLLLDIRMPGMSGLELQERLVRRKSILPILFITGHGSVDAAVHAMQAGAVDFLQKPFDEKELLNKIQSTLEQDRKNREMLSKVGEIRERIASLTPRELEVMGRVVRGDANKVVAIDLGVSERTVEIHRSRVMHKMEASSLPHLVRMIFEAEPERLQPETSREEKG